MGCFMDIAIVFEKIVLDENRFLFKPISIIKGQYEEENNMFFGENGVAYFSIDDVSVNAENFFGFPIKLEDIKNDADEDTPEAYLFSNYLYTHKKDIYFGQIKEDDTISIVKVGDEVFKDSSNEETQQAGSQSSNDIDDTNKLSLKRQESFKFNLARFRKHMLRTVISQDNAVFDVSNALAVNYTSTNPKNKSHIMIIGPRGTGKTTITDIIANKLKVPVLKVDATDYNSNWHVKSIIIDLIKSTDGDIEAAKNGIIIIDNLDESIIGFEDPVRRAVLNSFVEIMQREVIEIRLDDFKSFIFDTSNLTLIFTCQFAELYKNKTGFSDEVKITDKDFIEYGLTPQFLSSIGTITYTNKLTLEDLVEIMYKSSIIPIKIKREWFKNNGVKTIFINNFYSEAAKKCLSLNMGAYPLNRIVNDSLKKASDTVLLEGNKIKQIKFTRDTVINPKQYYTK